MTETHQFISWALRVTITDVPASIGVAKVRLVLVCLANHADREGLAFPSQHTVAGEIDGCARRDVQNALSVLEKAGLIARNGSKGRATAYRLQYVEETELTGYPVEQLQSRQTVYPVNSQGADLTGHLTGQLTGQLTGNLPGYPVTNGIEENEIPPTPQRSDRRDSTGTAGHRGGNESQAIQRLIKIHRLSHREASAVVEIAKSDTTTTTTWGNRLLQPRYVEQCLSEVKEQQRRHFAAGPDCERHIGQKAANCGSCRADLLAGVSYD
ncbi:helix-turn-helix domain-containing protein [Paenarthrobacter ureafaciens]|uniref:helix-turn-helix domain-containing protein n=1 Tax=Paenarthrobacter ureafaciens TaxID=37931 RepID=UPI002DBEA4C9|nr:helix-turn-helix domain-containing protein [Paenarthrobacter ureafaciens]MEC3853462.1 helix-turn-helix domain-containing protein [Paenarthrobacter ureafaciens]